MTSYEIDVKMAELEQALDESLTKEQSLEHFRKYIEMQDNKLILQNHAITWFLSLPYEKQLAIHKTDACLVTAFEIAQIVKEG